ncbi:FtsX-like permease family protein [Roseiconus lacunae]|uniref:ABC transporter permease n=1 Tax=Roseiconus lacunae TaxID=2605694 RepID=UPI0030921472|nr:FtsX-like permease family protein [Stieleria sp. HD01]
MQSWPLIAKLVTAQMKFHPTRAIITTLGVIASTCAVVWVVSGYDSLVASFDDNAGKYLGRYDVLVVPKGPPGSVQTIPQRIIDELKIDAGVLELNAISQSRISVQRVPDKNDQPEEESALGLLIGHRPPVFGAPPIDPTLVSTPAPTAPYQMIEGEWLANPANNDDQNTIENQRIADEAVISSNAADHLNAKVGDQILVTSLSDQVTLNVVGIVEQPSDSPSFGGRGRRGGGPNREKPAEKGSRPAGPPNADQQLSQGNQSDDNGSTTSETKRLHQFTVPTGFVQGVATNAVYVRPSLAARINGHAAKANVLQVALRDTVSAKQFGEAWSKQFAATQPPLQLVDYSAVREGLTSTRSVGSQRSQAWAATGMASIAAIFIIFSTLSMGVSERVREFAMLRAIALTRGQIAGIIAIESVLLALIGWLGGLAAGFLLVMVGSRVLPGLFNAGSAIGWTSVLLSGLTVLAGALGAAILPAIRATRINPLEAMNPRRHSPRWQNWTALGLAGFVLAAMTPLVVFLLPMSNQSRLWSYSFVAYPALFIGMLLMAPLVVVISERVFGPILTSMMRLDSRLVKTQLSSNMWRTIGATLSLSVGLGLFASTQTWGYSMLQPFLPGQWLPDMLVAFHPIGLDEHDVEKIKQVDGVRAGEVLPLAIEQAKFDWGKRTPPEGMKYDNAVLFGVDPHRAFAGEDALVDIDFVSGDRDAAIKKLSAGRHCLISEDFQMLTKIQVGETLRFTPPNAPNETVAYTVAGVAALPGWQWVTKFSGVRRHFVRTSCMIFANHDHIQKDFHLDRAEFFWLNLHPGVSIPAVERQLQKLAEENSGESFQSDQFGEVKAYRPFARATATANVKKAISIRANDMIWGMSYLPLVTLAIMSLAVVNTVVASVRSRTWEFGVMRAVGVTAWQLVRLIVVETILIGMAACTLSLIFGLIAGWCGVGMAQYGGYFFGGAPQFVIPWHHLAIGFAMTLTLCLIASVWPSVRTGRLETLSLLQAGRGSM